MTTWLSSSHQITRIFLSAYFSFRVQLPFSSSLHFQLKWHVHASLLCNWRTHRKVKLLSTFQRRLVCGVTASTTKTLQHRLDSIRFENKTKKRKNRTRIRNKFQNNDNLISMVRFNEPKWKKSAQKETWKECTATAIHSVHVHLYIYWSVWHRCCRCHRCSLLVQEQII